MNAIPNNIYIDKIILQKKKKNHYISIEKPLLNSFLAKTDYGIINFIYKNNILDVYVENFVNNDDIPINFIILELKIDKINNFKTFLHQGYNNWTQTYEVPIKNKMENVNVILRWLLAPFGESTIIKFIQSLDMNLLRSHFYTYLRDFNNHILLFCSLNEKESYTIFQLDYKNSLLRIIKDYQFSVLKSNVQFLKLFIDYGEYYSVFNHLSNQFEKINEELVTGYTSWYYHYNNISYNELLKRIEFYGINKIPIDYFQIDDGYQKRVGDWLNLKEDFVDKMNELVSRVESYQFKAGIWIAPFICERKSYLYQYHQEWLLRDHKDKVVVAGFNPLWSGRFYALNIYHPDFQDYLRDVLHTFVNEWGFQLLKLDFLYASCIYPAKKRTRAQQMQDALTLIHKIINWRKSKVKLLGCGIPFSHTFGNINYTRIGSDVEEKWENYLKNFNFLERVSTFSSLNSTIYRHFFNGKNFLNDPDVFILRDKFRSLKPKDLLKKIELDDNEKLTLLYVNFIMGGLVFTSDPIENYDKETFSLYRKVFPLLKKEFKKFIPLNQHIFEVHFSIKKNNFFKYIKNEMDIELEYVFFTNLSNKKVNIQLEKNQNYFVAFPFQNQYGTFLSNKESIIINPHHSLLLYKIEFTHIPILGSTGHIIPLSEIKYFTKKKQGIQIELEDKAFEYSKVYISIPKKEKEKYLETYSIQEENDFYYYTYEVIK